jgi:hypothetical protein
MSVGLGLGLLTNYFAWKPVLFRPRTSDVKTGEPSGMTERESITLAAVLGSLYWITGLSAILYPGTLFTDPEFGTGAPQLPLFSGLVAVVWLGWGLEMSRLSKKEKRV